MRFTVLIAIALLLAFGGEWIYRSFLRPIDPLASDATALAEHFNRNGIQVRPYPIRHGFRHSEVLSVAGYEISGYPLPVVVEFCTTEAAATEKLQMIKASPNLAHYAKNGRLVMSLPMWGDDTDPMATKVKNVFGTFVLVDKK
ncbi:hypothetical protein L2750_12740 [Shewanella submarina]|uniref:DUF302 domain-containing protein n=1 Tax=Shewanella submarina TaxID=2016376 RepID=A0ABV7GKL2_9GAMM|nr:hypothetical protein [Shewanella submarina]MCL1038017.1 hypothetical protein [Shewanella submarina]